MSGARVVKRLDARPLRARGIHPVEQVLADLRALLPGEAYELVTPHPPGLEGEEGQRAARGLHQGPAQHRAVGVVEELLQPHRGRGRQGRGVDHLQASQGHVAPSLFGPPGGREWPRAGVRRSS